MIFFQSAVQWRGALEHDYFQTGVDSSQLMSQLCMFAQKIVNERVAVFGQTENEYRPDSE